jgi:hypothetical protein
MRNSSRLLSVLITCRYLPAGLRLLHLLINVQAGKEDVKYRQISAALSKFTSHAFKKASIWSLGGKSIIPNLTIFFEIANAMK